MKRVYRGPRARATLQSNHFAFCTGARRRYAVQKNGTGPFCLARKIGGISFFIFHRRRRRRTICFAARRAPAKTGDRRSSRLTAACRKDDDGDDRVVTMRFCPCFIHAKTRVPVNSIFHRGIQDVARYDAASDFRGQIEESGDCPLNRSAIKTYFHAILSRHGFVSDSYRLSQPR